eukprot:Skav233515  [mRNA]  locus=scaffold1225:82181:86555:- [translate_table: standard]
MLDCSATGSPSELALLQDLDTRPGAAPAFEDGPTVAPGRRSTGSGQGKCYGTVPNTPVHSTSVGALVPVPNTPESSAAPAVPPTPSPVKGRKDEGGSKRSQEPQIQEVENKDEKSEEKKEQGSRVSGRVDLKDAGRSVPSSSGGPMWPEGPIGYPRVLQPLFDEEQLRRFEMLRQQAPLLESTRADAQMLAALRPQHLDDEEARLRKEKQEWLARKCQEVEEERLRLQEENEKLKSVVKEARRVYWENQYLKDIARTRAADEVYQTPEEERKEELGREGKTKKGRRAIEDAKEAVHPQQEDEDPPKPRGRFEEAVGRSGKGRSSEVKEAARPPKISQRSMPEVVKEVESRQGGFHTPNRGAEDQLRDPWSYMDRKGSEGG